MIKKAFQCDPVPWTILYGVIMICLVLRILVFPIGCEYTGELTSYSEQLIEAQWLQFLLKSLGVIVIPFWFRKIIRRSGILDFRERVSLYPIGLFLITVVLSCNAITWLLLVLLNLGIFSTIVNLREDGSLNSAAFKAGILTALCTFFSPFFFLLSLLVLSSLSVIRALDWKSTVWHILGVLTPWYLGYALYYIISGSLDFYGLTESLLISDSPSQEVHKGFSFIFYLIVTISMTLYMLHLSFGSSRTAIVKRRKFLRIGALFFLITLIISALILQFESASPFLSLIAIPLSVIYLELFKDGRTKVHSVLFILWLLATFLFVWN